MNEGGLHPWDRRPGETPYLFSLFVKYRDMGPARSLRKMGAALGAGHTQLGNHCSRFDWVDRAGAWDEHLDRERRLEAVVEAREMARQHVVVAKTALLKASEKLGKINAERLTVREAVLLAQFAVATERAARGEPDHVIESRQTPKRARGADILQTLREAPDLLDLARQIDERLAANDAQPPD